MIELLGFAVFAIMGLCFGIAGWYIADIPDPCIFATICEFGCVIGFIISFIGMAIFSKK